MKKKATNYMLALLPFLIIVIMYELLPLLTVIVNSFKPERGSGITLENYIKIFTTPLYTSSIINSLKISLISAFIGIALAFIGANAYDNAGNGFRKFYSLVLNMTSNFSGIPLAFAFMLIMGNAGFLILLGKQLGISWLANFDLYTGNGLLLIYIYFQIPLSTLLLIPAFSSIKKEWKEAAVLLSAGPVKFWTKIGIPVILPSLLGTLSVLFSNALAAYATAYALLSTNYSLLPIQITSKFKGDVQIKKELGGALSVVMIVLMLIATLINNYFTKKATSKGGK